MKFPKLRATFMALLATTALAACAGGISGIPRVASPTAGAGSVHASGTLSPAGAQAMAPMSNPCKDVPNSVGAGGVTTMSSCQDCQSSGTCQTCPNGSQGDGCAVGAPGPPPGWNNCVIGCNPGNPGDPINVGPPCQPISSCIAYTGKPKQGIHCDGAQFAVGDPVSPGNENANNTAFFVNTEAGLWQNGQVVGYLYQGTYSADGTGQSFFGIQITNNASWNFGATIGINFGPIDVGVGGGYGVNDVSRVQWWNGKLPLGVNARNCWKSYPVQGT